MLYHHYFFCEIYDKIIDILLVSNIECFYYRVNVEIEIMHFSMSKPFNL